MKENDILKFENLATIVSGIKTNDFELSAEVKKTEEVLVKKLIERVKNEFDAHPFIVFMAKENQKLIDGLKRICTDR